MKKTIAILLVLAIGMIGVFAAPDQPTDAKLNLSTEVALVNRLAITDWQTVNWTFGEDPDKVSVDFDPENAYVADFDFDDDDPETLAAHIHYKSNNAKGVTITFNATALVNGTNSTLLMPYKLKVGDAFVVAETAAPTTATGNIFSAQDYTPMVEDTEQVLISIPGSSDDYAGGTYTATVTFIFTAS